MSFFSRYKHYLVVLVFLIISLAFYSPAILKNKIPLPADILLGAYYPWLDYSWGYPVSMPIKNPLISDVFSYNYPVKSLIAESIKNGQVPLWNPYSFSGYPLLATFGSGVFNPFNLLMVVFGDQSGWLLMLISECFFSMLFMYLFLKDTSKNIYANFIGAILYALNAFALSWSQFMSASFALIYLPLILLLIRKEKYLLLPFVYFLLMSSGHTQALYYGFAFSCVYFLYLNWQKFKTSKIFYFLSSLIIAIAYMSVQLLPTIELSKLSVRFEENYIQEYHYGLLPLSNLITFLSPDFFGNPATNNYWGFFNYHETIIYSTIFAFIALVYFIFSFKTLKKETRYFLIFSLLILLFVFDNPLSRLVYTLKIPVISTSAAARLIFLFVFCLSVLCRDFMVDLSTRINKIKLLKSLSTVLIIIFSQLVLVYILKKYFLTASLSPQWYSNLNIAFRNTLLFCFLSLLYALILIISLKYRKGIYLIALLLLIETFRYGWKYLPFTERKFVFATTPIIEYLKNDPEKYFRVASEKGAVLPSNTWTLFRLFSPVGYDPLALKDYYLSYNQKANRQINKFGVSRYLDTTSYFAKDLGDFNVKYLLFIKKDLSLEKNIKLKDWDLVLEDHSLVLLQNKQYRPRIELLTNQKNSSISIEKYTPNYISLRYHSPQNVKSELILRDASYPGWKAYDNGQEIPIISTPQSKKVNIKGDGLLEFSYQPKSFILGIYILLIGALYHLGLYIICSKHKKWPNP